MREILKHEPHIPARNRRALCFGFIYLLLILNQGKGSGPLSQEVEKKVQRRSMCVTLCGGGCS